MPPVEMMMLVLPALSASRTSIHVISSSHTLLAAGRGFGASAQLYGLSRQSPPPIDRGSGARRGCCWADARVALTARPSATRTIFFIGPLLCGLDPERAVFHALAVLAVARRAGAAERRDRRLGGVDVVHAEVDQDRVRVLLAFRGPLRRFLIAL